MAAVVVELGGERLAFLFVAGAASGVRLRSSVTCGTCASSSAASRRACSTARGGAAAAAASKKAIVARRLRKGAPSLPFRAARVMSGRAHPSVRSQQ